jgi:hypothetical protein
MRDHDDSLTARLRAELSPLRGLWHGIDKDLMRLGVTKLADLRGQNPEQLMHRFCALEGRAPDPMLVPVFSALVAFAETGHPQPWWMEVRRRARADRRALLSDRAL